MGELKKKEEFQPDKNRIFQMIKYRLLDNSTPIGVQNQYVMDNPGVSMAYTIKEITEDEKIYTDLSSRSIDGYLNSDFGDLNSGSFVDVDIKPHNRSVFGGLVNFVVDIEKIESKLVYELKKELGEPQNTDIYKKHIG